MRKAIRKLRTSSSKKRALTDRIEELYDMKVKIDSELKKLKGEVPKYLAPSEKVGRVRLVEVESMVVTEALKNRLVEDDQWEDVLADPRVDMKRLRSLLKSCPHLKDLVEYETSTKVNVGKKKDE